MTQVLSQHTGPQQHIIISQTVDTAAVHCGNTINRRYVLWWGNHRKVSYFCKALVWESHCISCGTCKHSWRRTRTHEIMTHCCEPGAPHHKISHPYLMGSLVCPWRQGGLWCNKWSGRVWGGKWNNLRDEWHCEPMMPHHRADYLDSKHPPSKDTAMFALNIGKNLFRNIWHVVLFVCVCVHKEMTWIDSK